MKNKQTAVDWLMDKLKFINKEAYAELYNESFEQAKQMEKEQIKQAFKDCHDLGHIYGLDTEQYYNKTYGSKAPQRLEQANGKNLPKE